MVDDDGRYLCDITGRFNIVSKLSVNIRLFRALLAYLPTTHVRQIKSCNITDANVNIIRDTLSNVVCDELVISEYVTSTRDQMTAGQIANMLVNVSTVANVVIDDCHNVNIEELRNHYPAITFRAPP